MCVLQLAGFGEGRAILGMMNLLLFVIVIKVITTKLQIDSILRVCIRRWLV